MADASEAEVGQAIGLCRLSFWPRRRQATRNDRLSHGHLLDQFHDRKGLRFRSEPFRFVGCSAAQAQSPWETLTYGEGPSAGGFSAANMQRRVGMGTAKPFSIITIPIAALTLILSSPLAQAQAPGQLPEFEVASIKPNKTNERMYYGLRNATMTVRNMTVKGLIQIAYGKRDFQITGGPGWITSECFDIDAKAERPQKATQDMLKSLLASRFQLKLHRQTKETSVYSLVVARGGLKMKLSADQTEPEKGGPKELGPGRLAGEGIPMYIVTN